MEQFPFSSFLQAQHAWQDELFNEVARQAAEETRQLQRGIDRDVENLEDELRGLRRPHRWAKNSESTTRLKELKKTRAQLYDEAERRRQQAESEAIARRASFSAWRDTDAGTAFITWCDQATERCNFIFEYHTQWENFYRLEVLRVLHKMATEELGVPDAHLAVGTDTGTVKLTGKQAAAIAEKWDFDQRTAQFGFDPLAPGSEPPGPWVTNLSVYFDEVRQVMMKAFNEQPEPDTLPQLPILMMKTEVQLGFTPMVPYLRMMRDTFTKWS